MLEEAAQCLLTPLVRSLRLQVQIVLTAPFEVEVEELDSDTEFTTEDEEEAHELLETVA